MAKFDPTKEKKMTADEQRKEFAGGFYAPPDGVHVVVSTRFRRSRTNGGYERAHLTCHILKTMRQAEGVDPALYAESIGKRFQIDLWLDMDKQGNRAMLAQLCNAVGVTEAFDVDSDEEFARAVTGTPFFIETRQAKRSYKKDGETINLVDVRVAMFEALAADKRKAYKQDPDWDSIVPLDVKDRIVVSKKDRDGGGDSGKRTSTDADVGYDDGFRDDGLPF
jgi:hypothetical protein